MILSKSLQMRFLRVILGVMINLLFQLNNPKMHGATLLRKMMLGDHQEIQVIHGTRVPTKTLIKEMIVGEVIIKVLSRVMLYQILFGEVHFKALTILLGDQMHPSKIAVQIKIGTI